MDPLLLLASKESDSKKVKKLREQFRMGKIDLETYINNYPKKPRQAHEKIWHEIFESIATSPTH